MAAKNHLSCFLILSVLKFQKKRPRILILMQQILVTVDLLHQVNSANQYIDHFRCYMPWHNVLIKARPLLLVQYVRPIIILFLLAKRLVELSIFLTELLSFWQVNKVILVGWKFVPLVACLSLTHPHYT